LHFLDSCIFLHNQLLTSCFLSLHYSIHNCGSNEQQVYKSWKSCNEDLGFWNPSSNTVRSSEHPL
jgi:hypothetical protein